MATSVIEFLKSTSVSVTNNSTTVTLTGSVNSQYVHSGTVVFIDNYPPVEAVSGTPPDGSGNSTITLAYPWGNPTVTAKPLIAFNTMEGLAEAIRKGKAMSDTTLALTTSFETLLNSTTSTVSITINGVPTTFVPYQYMANKLQTLSDNAGSLYAMTKAEFDALAETRIRDNAGSGFLEWGKHHSNTSSYPNINQGLWSAKTDISFLPSLWLGRDSSVTHAGISNANMPLALIDGVVLSLENINNSTTFHNQIEFPPAPDGLDKADGTGRFADLTAAIAAGGTGLTQSVISRQDLVFLEVWHEKISDKDVVYPLGNVQYGVGTWNGVTLSNTAVAQGYSAFGEWDTATKGYGVKWSTLTAANQTKFIQDNKNNIYSDDGELIQVRYRIRVVKGLGDSWGNVDPSTSLLRYASAVNVVAQGGSTTSPVWGAGSSAVDYFGGDSTFAQGSKTGYFSVRDIFSDAHNGLCFAVPIALVQRRNQGAFHPVYNPNGTSSQRNTANTGNVLWHDSTAYPISSLSSCFDKINVTPDVTKAYIGTAYIVGRSDGKFYDAIYASDVEDLRVSARRKTPQELLSYTKKAIAGELRGFEGVPYLTVAGTNTSLNITLGDTSRLIVPTTTANKINIGDLLVSLSATGVVVKTHVWAKNDRNDGSFNINISDAVSNIKYLVFHTYTDTKSESPTWTDIIGDPARIAATFPNGVEGQWIPVIPDGTGLTYDLNRKVVSTYDVVSTTDDGVTYLNGSWVYFVAFNTTENSFVSSVAANQVLLFSYETKANFLETANNVEVLELSDKAYATSANLVEAGTLAIQGLINKVGTAGDITKSSTLTYSTLRTLNGIVVMQDDGSTWKQEHLPVTILGTGAAVKFLPYITSENSQYYLQFVYKEMKHNGTSWGDNNKFNIVSGESTVTDDNGQTVKVGQKRVKLPYFTGES